MLRYVPLKFFVLLHFQNALFPAFLLPTIIAIAKLFALMSRNSCCFFILHLKIDFAYFRRSQFHYILVVCSRFLTDLILEFAFEHGPSAILHWGNRIMPR